MTKAQIWTAVFLGLFILLFAVERLTKESPSSKDMPSGMGMMTESAPAKEMSGKDLVGAWNCASCHGSDLKGTSTAPSLYALSTVYSAEQLASYLQNPNSLMGSDRFKAYKQKYRSGTMPSFGNKDVKDIQKVVEYVLSLQ